jgi:glycosyltransferase involved in cell wall biosynthesis
MPAFSVIIPTRDRPHFLKEAVTSVLSQSISDIEIIIVNDGADSILDFDDTRIRILDNEQRGPVRARNLGVTNATGLFIAFLDDDDRWISEDFLKESAVRLADDAALTFGDGIMQFPGESMPRDFAHDADAKSLAKDNTILISAVCYHRSLHNTLGMFDETLPYYWDWDWYLRIARSGQKLARINHPVVDIRIHPQNMSGDSNTKLRQENLSAFAAKHGIGPLALKNHASFAE